MATPKNVKKQAKEAAKLQEDLVKARTPEAKAGGAPEEIDKQKAQTGSEPAPGEETGGKPATDAGAIEGEGVKSKEAEGKLPEATQEDWRKRYEGMKRKYDDTVPPLREQAKTQQARLDTLETELNQLRDQITDAAATPSADESRKVEVTEADVDEYGQKLIDLITRVSGGAQDPTTDLAKQVIDLKSQLESVQRSFSTIEETATKTTKQEFYEGLDGICANWREVNRHPGFLSWLEEEHAGTGEIRHVFLQKAFSDGDVNRTAKFFTDWLESREQSPSVTAADLEEHVHQDTAGAGQPVVGDEEEVMARIWYTDEITQFYRDKQSGLYKKTKEGKAEAKRIEKDILAAGAQGRVRERRHAS